VFEDPILEGLRRNDANDQMVIAYKLMLDNKRHNGTSAGLRLESLGET
jgi:hypothetical protein